MIVSGLYAKQLIVGDIVTDYEFVTTRYGEVKVYTVERSESAHRNYFSDLVNSERQRQIEMGYTAERDDKSGVDHLLMWAVEYAARNEIVKSAALIEAARESLGRKYGIPLRSLDEAEEIPDDLSYEEQYGERS